VIGSSIKETEASELMTSQRESVAVALGVPPSVINANSANYATANADMLSLYQNTIIPEIEILFESANEQLYNPLGLSVEAHPERLEVMQDARLAQAKTVAELAGRPIITVNEARDFIELDPINDGDTLAQSAPQSASAQSMNATQSSNAQSQTSDAPSIASLTLWRRMAIDAMRSTGSSNVSVPSDIPLEYVAIVDSELRTCKSVADIRKVFARHWRVKTATQTSDLSSAIDKLSRVLSQ
jgi:hypothetical protein